MPSRCDVCTLFARLITTPLRAAPIVAPNVDLADSAGNAGLPDSTHQRPRQQEEFGGLSASVAGERPTGIAKGGDRPRRLAGHKPNQ